jgi:hypothetical protein
VTKSAHYKYVGECSCGWRGPIRWNDVDSNADVRQHCLDTGCKADTDTTGAEFTNDEELMPHERAKARRERGEQA